MEGKADVCGNRMTTTSSQTSLKWHSLELFDQRFQTNLAALQSRDPALASRLRAVVLSRPFFIAAEGDTVFLGRPGAAGMEVIPNAISPASAREMAAKLFQSGNVGRPIVVGGLAYGWLWDRMAKLPCKVENAIGHRPPIYLLAGDVERLWAVLHVMDWQALLADPRLPIFAGPDAVAQLSAALVENPTLPRPRASICVESNLWQQDINSVLDSVSEATERKLRHIREQLDSVYASISPDEWASRFKAKRLRVLGVTSRYTTFLQYSMRDWLSAFERLGHDTRLLIEPFDHVMPGASGYAQGVLDFKPDLILVIDHYRAELGKLPESIPCVMWVQDRLPNIFNPAAGAAQTARDYAIGFGRLHLSARHAYPIDRFMSCTIGINDEKFSRQQLSRADLAKYGCDVSYVSHASTPADVLLKAQLDKNPTPDNKRIFWNFYHRMVAHFEGGGTALSDQALRRKLLESVRETRINLPMADAELLLAVFNHQINNALFRHQALQWVADTGVDLCLYGNGWEKHPRLSRYARGPADNQNDLPKIYRASKINLQVTPHGAVHQRLLDGLAAGAFFLIRHTAGDELGVTYQRLWDWCGRNDVTCDSQLRTRADAEALALIAECDRLLGYVSAENDMSLYDCLAATADADFMTLAGAVWPEEYPQVSFRTAEDLGAKLLRFLNDDARRLQMAEEMRKVVIKRCSYLSISRRLMKFISIDLDRAAGGRVERPATEPIRVAA
jgi:hypothetical protein